MKGTPAPGFFFDQIEILAFADAETLDGEGRMDRFAAGET